MRRIRFPFFYGWWVVSAASAIVLVTSGTVFYGFSAIVNPIAQETGWSRAIIGGGFSVRAEMSGLAAPIIGLALDRLGSRRLLLIGVCVVVIGMFVLSRMQTIWQFYLSMVIIAGGVNACGGAVGWAAAANWFRRKRARAMSIITVGGALSGIMVIVFAWLIEQLGWRDALLVIAAIALVIGFPMALTVRDRPEPYGLLPDGDSARPSHGTEVRPATAERSTALSVALRTRTFWALAVAMALGNMTSTGLVVHQIPALTNVGISQGLAVATATALPLMSLGGRLLSGWLGDMLDKRRVMATAAFAQAIGIVIFSQTTLPWMVLLFLVVYPTGFGATIPVRPALQAEVFGIGSFGSIQGALLTISTLGAMVGPLVVGRAFDVTGSYQGAYLTLGLMNLLSAPLLLLIPGRTATREVSAAGTAKS